MRRSGSGAREETCVTWLVRCDRVAGQLVHHLSKRILSWWTSLFLPHIVDVRRRVAHRRPQPTHLDIKPGMNVAYVIGVFRLQACANRKRL